MPSSNKGGCLRPDELVCAEATGSRYVGPLQRAAGLQPLHFVLEELLHEGGARAQRPRWDDWQAAWEAEQRAWARRQRAAEKKPWVAEKKPRSQQQQQQHS